MIHEYQNVQKLQEFMLSLLIINYPPLTFFQFFPIFRGLVEKKLFFFRVPVFLNFFFHFNFNTYYSYQLLLFMKKFTQ